MTDTAAETPPKPQFMRDDIPKQAIYKYDAPMGLYTGVQADPFTIEMPEDAEVLGVQVQRSMPCILARVIPRAPLTARRFHWRATGGSLDGVGRYVGTVQSPDEQYVFHLFEALP